MSEPLFIIGDDHPYRFPNIKGFLSPNKLDETLQQLAENKVWNLSEKLDGCNVTVSSVGWFASRNKIVADCRDPNLTGRVWNNVSLRNVPLVFEQAIKLREVLKSALHQDWLQVNLYCELVLPGTSTTPFDIYNYEARNIKKGSLYAFALGLLMPKNVSPPFMFDNAVHMENLSNDCDNYYIVPMNKYLSQMFQDLDIVHIPPVAITNLASLLTNPNHIDILINRKKEGFVLTGNERGQGFIKWKYNKAEEEKPELTEAANRLIYGNLHSSLKRSAALQIEMVYKSGLFFVNHFSLLETCEFFNTHMARHNERWKKTFQRAANMGYYYLRLAMQGLEDELLRDLVLSLENQRKHKLDPKVVLQLKQEFARCVKSKCWQFIKQTREKIPSNECKCSILNEEAAESESSDSSSSSPWGSDHECDETI